MTRRTFLAATAGAAQTNPRIRIGFLGASHSHAADKVRISRESGDWDLAGIWEPDPAVAERYRKEGAPLVSREALLADPTVRVIAVESEVKTHAALALRAAEAGKHLHVEKPPADNMAELRKLLEIAGRKKLLVQMGYMWRHHPGMNAILEAARNGWLGDVYLVKGQMNTLIGPDRRPEWALFRGGQMFEQGSHLIDPMVRLLGRPLKVSGFLRRHGKFDDQLADNTVAVFEFPGALGVITSAVLQPNATPHRSFEVLGSNGTAVLRPIEGPPRLEMDLVKAAGPYPGGKREVPLPAYRRYEGDFAELADAVRKGKALAVTPQQDLDVQEALLRASEMWV